MRQLRIISISVRRGYLSVRIQTLGMDTMKQAPPLNLVECMHPPAVFSDLVPPNRQVNFSKFKSLVSQRLIE